MLADRELGQKIINDIIEQSGEYGTAVQWDESRGICVVRIPAATEDR